MQMRLAMPDEFTAIRQFYHELIGLMQEQSEIIGWKKGIYPTDEFICSSLEKHELYVLISDGRYAACVIVNSEYNEGYKGINWGVECRDEDVLIPHALGVHPDFQRKGFGKSVVGDIIELGKSLNRKAIRLDILPANKAAEKLYTSMGFSFVQSRDMFYEDTGITRFDMYELIL